MKVSWPTAAVLIVFLAGYFALQYVGKLPPWMADVAAAAGMWLLATMRSLRVPVASDGKTPAETPAAKGQAGFAMVQVIVLLALAAAATWVLLVLEGCGAGTPTPLEQAEIVDYGSAQVTCAYLAKSPGDSDRCADAVRAYWCGDAGPLRAAGACDGGNHAGGK